MNVQNRLNKFLAITCIALSIIVVVMFYQFAEFKQRAFERVQAIELKSLEEVSNITQHFNRMSDRVDDFIGESTKLSFAKNDSSEPNENISSVLDRLLALEKQMASFNEKLPNLTRNHTENNKVGIQETNSQSLNPQSLNHSPLTQFDDNFYSRDIDPTTNSDWSLELSEYIGEKIQLNAWAGASLNEFDCRGDACRIDMVIESREQGMMLSKEIGDKVSWEGEVIVAVQNDKLIIRLINTELL